MMHGPPEIVEKAAVGTGSMKHMTEQMPSTRKTFIGAVSAPVAKVVDGVYSKRMYCQDTFPFATIVE